MPIDVAVVTAMGVAFVIFAVTLYCVEHRTRNLPKYA